MVLEVRLKVVLVVVLEVARVALTQEELEEVGRG